ncbi:hypothetical protein LTS10_010468 [Elasticomyces elasticus]|nr:hypothetical protein LTS10_010468 [Elasticomyces elasticus]
MSLKSILVTLIAFSGLALTAPTESNTSVSIPEGTPNGVYFGSRNNDGTSNWVLHAELNTTAVPDGLQTLTDRPLNKRAKADVYCTGQWTPTPPSPNSPATADPARLGTTLRTVGIITLS